MKRSEQLKLLSWEHHDALKFARHIRKGLDNGTEPMLIANYVLHIYLQFLRPHFELEEQSLIARLSSQQLEQDCVRQVQQEHAEIARLADALKQAEASQISLMLKQWPALLKSHVTLEEKQFFPYCEQVLSDRMLQQVAAELEQGHIPALNSWEPKFWL